jgi:hypothetical protein
MIQSPTTIFQQYFWTDKFGCIEQMGELIDPEFLHHVEPESRFQYHPIVTPIVKAYYDNMMETLNKQSPRPPLFRYACEIILQPEHVKEMSHILTELYYTIKRNDVFLTKMVLYPGNLSNSFYVYVEF